MTAIIDRIEGKLAVVELAPGSFENVPVSDIEGRARDGAVLTRVDGGYVVNEAATARRSSAARERLQGLFDQGKS